MALETGTFISDLVVTNPPGSDPKSGMDDHLRLIKSCLRNTFPNINGAVTATDEALNSVLDRGLIAGQTWTGTHTFPATTFGVTAAVGASGLKYATLDWVNFTILGLTLPGQAGNAGKFIRTNGSAASWSEFGVKGSDIASAATLDITSPDGDLRHVTGTTGITAITLPVGAERTLIFDGTLTLTHSAALLLPGAANITTAANDRLTVRGDTGGAIVTHYTKASGRAVSSSLVLLATIVPTVAATIDFLSVFTSEYDGYLIRGAVAVGADDSLVYRFANAGVVDAGSNYYSMVNLGSPDSTLEASGLISAAIASAGKGATFVINVENVNSAAGLKTASSTAVFQNSAAGANGSVITTAYVGGAASGIRFFLNAGSNFAAQGVIRVYGYRNS